VLRNVVQTFVERLTERELDAPLLAVLAAHGFTDIHFLHGAYEFGKDVIARKTDADGAVWQYAIQSKAGDLGLSEWRAVRPQLEECFHNDVAHPGFDAALPRVAVLVTTGRLKGGATTDAQQFGLRRRERGESEFEVWDVEQLVDWISDDPSVGLAGSGSVSDLTDLVRRIEKRTVDEPTLEKHSRAWVMDDDGARRRACLETAIVCAALRDSHRLDLAALVALHLLRAGWRPSGDEPDAQVLAVAQSLFALYAEELLDQLEPLLEDPARLLYPVMDFMAIVTYPAVVCRLAEVVSLLALSTTADAVRGRAQQATVALCSKHPGATRPPSDQFAASVIPAAIVLGRADPQAARTYLRALARWIVKRHDPRRDALGLGSLDESGSDTTARLLGGALTFDAPDRRFSSYLTVVVLDLLLAFGERNLYDAFLQNVDALKIVPTAVFANERRARWRRNGQGVAPQPRLDYTNFDEARPAHHGFVVQTDPVTATLLSAAARNRHYPGVVRDLLAERSAAT
jgi:hypothetical protein